MNIFSEQLFFDLEPKYAELMAKIGLPINNNRFRQAFSNYSKLNSEMKQANTQIIPEKWSTQFKHAVYDLTELLDIYHAINDYPDSVLLRNKLKLMNDGVNSPADETPTNAIARNIQFELILFSELRKAGVVCKLCEPNPDIEITSQLIGHSYAIECKRIYSFSDSKVHSSIIDARDQLNQLLSKKPYQTGIIALDVTRRLTQGTDYLRAKNESVLLARLSHELDQFRVKYMRYFSPQKIGDKRILAILLHASMYAYIEDRGLASHAAYTVVHEIHSQPYSKKLFRNMMHDVALPLSRHKDPLNQPSIIQDKHRKY